MADRFDDLRERITETDRRIVAEVNARLVLVTELWELKRELGLDRVDPDREQRLRAALADANEGPLSPDGLESLISAVLALTKRELGS